jgi:GAF domain-containing protein
MMIALSAISAFLAFVLWGALRALPLQSHHAPLIVAALLTLAITNSLYPIYLTGEPRYTVLLLLAIVVAGLVLFASRWLVVLLVASLGGWIVVMTPFSTHPEWVHFGFGLGLATVVALAAHVIRRRHCEQTARLQRTNAQQHAALRRCAVHAETSAAVGYRINAGANLDALLNQIVEIVRIRYSCTYVGVFLMAESSDELVARAGTGSTGRTAIANGTRIKTGHGIIGGVAASRRITYVEDTARDSRFVVWNLRPDTRSELTLPLQVGEQLLGVFDLQSDQTHAFPKDDIAAIRLLADQVTLAIQNVQLSQMNRERHRFTDTLYHIGRALSRTLNKQEVLDLILQQLAGVIPHERGAILLQHDNVLKLVAVRGFPENRSALPWRVPIRPGDVFSEIRQTQRVLVLDDALRRTDWYHLDHLLPARSWMGVPLIHQDQVIGMLSLARETHAPYAEDEIAVATAIAWQAAIALENARLYDQLSRLRQKVATGRL